MNLGDRSKAEAALEVGQEYTRGSPGEPGRSWLSARASGLPRDDASCQAFPVTRQPEADTLVPT